MKAMETNTKKYKQKKLQNADSKLNNCGGPNEREYGGKTSTMDKAVKRALLNVMAESLHRSGEIEWMNQDKEEEIADPRYLARESTNTKCQDSVLIDVTDDQLKQVSEEDLCQRLANCLSFEKKIKALKDSEHERIRIMEAIRQCMNILENYDFKSSSFRLSLPSEALDVVTQEEKRMKKIFTMRNIRNTTGVYECVFPLETQDIHNNVVLLYAIEGNYDAFFDKFNHNVSLNGNGVCLPNCICMSRTSTYNINPFHLAAAYGQTKFIKELYYPGNRISTDLLEHYHDLTHNWNRCAISCTGMWPFDVAVYYDQHSTARQFLDQVNLPQSIRQHEIISVYSSFPYQKYKESPLSFAVHNGNMEMVRMLHKWRLIEPSRDVPQAFREAADQNNLSMLKYLWNLFPNASHLLDRGSSKTKPLNTPLHSVASSGNLECVTFLCKCSPNAVYLPDFCGDLPICCAIEQGHHAVINFLLQFSYSLYPGVFKASIIGNQISLAKKLFVSLVAKDIEYIYPVDFAIRCRNFHLAEHFLKSYIDRQLVNKPPYIHDITRSLHTFICTKGVPHNQYSLFCRMLLDAGAKVTMSSDEIAERIADPQVAQLFKNQTSRTI